MSNKPQRNNNSPFLTVPNDGITHNHHHPVEFNSPLEQKTITSLASLATPNHRSTKQEKNGLLASMSKNSLLASTLPSSLRKMSLQRDVSGNYEIPKMASNIPHNNKMEDDTDILRNPDRSLSHQHQPPSLDLEALNNDISDISSIEKLRLWRHDALLQHLYSTAEFIGNKILSITNDPTDAFWLAQVYYQTGAYFRAIDLLSQNDWEKSNLICRFLIGLCLFELQKYEEALDVIGETNPFASSNNMSFSQDSLSNNNNNIDINNNTNNNNDNISNNFVDINASSFFQDDGGIKLESSMCYIRGRIFLSQNSLKKAKQSFIEAVLVDVKNFEAFQQLTTNNLLSAKEEWNLIKNLKFSILGKNEDLIRNLYLLRLSDIMNPEIQGTAKNSLIENYYLTDNIDILLYDIQKLYNESKFKPCIELCQRAIEIDEFNKDILAIYISCLYEQDCKNKLYLLSHKLSESYPNAAITWFSIGTYYLSVNKITEARKNFSKSSVIDPRFAPALLGFSHTYALEGEHDQAISAYSTAARYFPGINAPNLFIGMQYMALNTISLAEEYFGLSYDISPNDPLLLNEMGVLYFKKTDYLRAKRFLKRAFEASKSFDIHSRTVLSIQINLSHTYRKLGDHEKAIQCIKSVLETSGKNSDLYCTLGFLYLKTKQIQKAIDSLHISLAMKSSNQSAQELLLHALEINVTANLEKTDHPLFFGISNKIKDNNNNNNQKNSNRYRKKSIVDLTVKKRSIRNATIEEFNKRIRKNKSHLLDTKKDIRKPQGGAEDDDEEEIMDMS